MSYNFFPFIQRIQAHLNRVEITNPRWAHFICSVIPNRCPFERKIQFWGHTIAHIPPLCHLNPFYAQLIGLRQKSLIYLAELEDEWGHRTRGE